MIHSTCWAHILHLTAEELRMGMPEAERFISSMKAALTKAPARRNLLLQTLNENDRAAVLPPVPVLTRWTTWVAAADYYWNNFDAVSKFIAISASDSAAMARLKQMLDSHEMVQQLERLSKVYQGLNSSITYLQNDNVPASSVWLNIKACEELLKCCGIQSTKLEFYFYEKHPAVQFWNDVQFLDPRKAGESSQTSLPDALANFSEDQIPLEEIVKYKLLASASVFATDPFQFWSNYKFELPTLSALALTALTVPASSASVERSFSQLKRLLTSARTSFTNENLETHLKILYNRNSPKESDDSDADG